MLALIRPVTLRSAIFRPADTGVNCCVAVAMVLTRGKSVAQKEQGARPARKKARVEDSNSNAAALVTREVKIELPNHVITETTETLVVKPEDVRATSDAPKKSGKKKATPKRSRKSQREEVKENAEAADGLKDAEKLVKKKLKKLKETAHTEESLPAIRDKASKIYNQLMEIYVDPPCPLDHANAFQLLTSVILSAQSTDKKVNEIVPPLYALAPDAFSMAKLEVSVIEQHIKKIGLAPTKAKSISKMSQALVERHGGQVPDSFDALEQLAGVGHKTASVVLAVAFKQPTFPVDTHIFRLGLRWGLTSGETVEQAEADLKMCWPEEQWNELHLRLIYFGREHCVAQRHDPTICPICSWAAVHPYNKVGQSPARAGAKKLDKKEATKSAKSVRKKLTLKS